MNSRISHHTAGVVSTITCLACGARSTLDDLATAPIVTSGGIPALSSGGNATRSFDGGAPASGGARSAGGSGASGGASFPSDITSGGTASSGGAGSLLSGGWPTLGGAFPTGGARASGGTLPTGGTRASGGTLPTGDTHASGGASSTGGSLQVTGGMTSAASSNSGGSSVDAGDFDDAGDRTRDSNGLRALTDSEFASFTGSECSAWFSIMTPPIVHLELVADVSASMAGIVRSTNGESTKWEIARSSLGAVLHRLPWLTRAGLLLWPNQPTIPNEYTQPYQQTGNVEACVNTAKSVAPAPLWGTNRVEDMLEVMNMAVPMGGTPTADAYAHGVTELTDTTLSGERFVILLTDGRPSVQLGCMGQGDENTPVDSQPVLDLIERSRVDDAVKTYVIGLPGSEQASLDGQDGRVWLSQAASLGGTHRDAGCRDSGPDYCHFDLTQSHDLEQALASALDGIIGHIFPCRYRFADDELFSEPLDMSRLNTILVPQTGGEEEWFVTPASAGCEDGNGWYLEYDGGNYLVLCPNTCRAFRELPAILQTFGDCPALEEPS